MKTNKNGLTDLKNWASKTHGDKIKHAGIGAFVFTICAFLLPLWISFKIVLIIAILNERNDAKFDWYDVLATTLTPALIWILILIS